MACPKSKNGLKKGLRPLGVKSPFDNLGYLDYPWEL
jgi:hypothetical protein